MLTENQIQMVDGLRGKALLAGLGGTAVTLVLALISGLFGGLGIEKFFQAFVIAYMLLLGLGIGSLALVMLHHLCGGSWSFVVQRIAEAGSRTIPFFFVAGLAVFGGALYTGVYSWVYPGAIEDPVVLHMVEKKTAFLNVGTFWVCYLVYFGIWGLLAFCYNHWSQRLDQTGDQGYIGLMKRFAAPGLILYVLSVTFAGTHWGMSLEPEWYSTIYGAWLIGAYALTTVAFSTIVLSKLADERPLSEAVTAKQYHHLGNFLLGFTIFWAYTSFSQFLIIWNGNMPEEIGYYLHRTGGGMTSVSIFLMVFHWFLPMLILLWRQNKLNIARLRRIAVCILCVRVVDVYWNLAASFPDSRSAAGTGYLNPTTVLMVLCAVAGLGGFWLHQYLGQLKKRPLLPLNDPRRELMFPESHGHGAHGGHEAHSHA